MPRTGSVPSPSPPRWASLSAARACSWTPHTLRRPAWHRGTRRASSTWPDYAIRPTSVGRGWFTDAEFARSLDALAAAQQDDGGWPINWAQWSPIAASESRPAVTTLALLTLRAHDAPGAS